MLVEFTLIIKEFTLIIKEPIFYLTFNKRSVGPPSAKALMLNVHKHGKFFDLQVAEGQLPHPYHL